ncbi:MAG TPA: hypothetical protein VLE95_03080, partial [Chlamydiales bacterium]|nr:hypothetical protein [Chlamydiales bacterium]
IQSGALQSLIQKKDAATAIFSIPCPLLVPMIEEGLVSHPAIKMVVDHYLEQLQGKQVDSALLACTHYPLIRGVIQEAVGRKVRLIEPARLCAKKTKHWLESHSLLNPAREKPVYQFYVSDNPQKFCRFTHQFFGSKIAKAAEPKFVDRLLPEMAPVEKKYDDL